MSSADINPFRYGDLALDKAFTDRAAELKELRSDIRNGQNVVVFAPRRYGKSSLIWRATQDLIRGRQVLVAQVDLMKAPTKERLAEKLASSIHDDIASMLFRVRERATEVFRGLRVSPMITLGAEGSLAFSFQPGHSSEDIDATIEHLLELPAELGAERNKRVALVFDEFQEIVRIDPNLLPLMRSIFQEQPDIAHVYLGSKRHMMEQIFNDANEPFWRSAKQMELGVIPPAQFASFIRKRFAETSRSVEDAAVDEVLAVTHAHPYGTQELAYALWELVPEGFSASSSDFEEALDAVVRSENAHFTLAWTGASRTQRLVLQALAVEPGRVYGGDYRLRHDLPAASSVQRAVEQLVADELVERRPDGGFELAEPFLREWILRFGS
jgi:hypothetical protein